MTCRGLLLVGLVGCAPAMADDGRADLPLEESAYTLSVSPEIASQVDSAFIRREVEASIALYRQIAEPAPLSIIVDAPGCLRTGYDTSSRTVQFCNNADTPRFGTASADVIHHEVFHALICATKPAWCDAERNVALHEGLADFFSYTLAPDDAFGEGFYRDKPVIRRYRTPLCYSLVSGGHEKGNAIVSELIARGSTLRDVARVVAGDELTLEALFGAAPENTCLGLEAPRVERTVTGYPESTLERYRIRPGAPLTIAFAGDAAFARRYPNLTIRWEPAPSPRFAITSVDARSFEVSATGSDGFDKVVALYVVDGQVVGGKPFYFQIAQP